MSREAMIREARRLRGLGWTAPAIGRRLGVSDSTVRNWYLGGDCVDCGAPVERSSGASSKRCAHCGGHVNGIALRGRGPVVQAALAFMSEPRRYMEVVRHLGITKEHAASMFNRLLRYGLIRRVSRGLYERVEA